MAVVAGLTADGAVLENGLLRLRLHHEGGRLVEHVSAFAGHWRPVLTSLRGWGDPRADLSPALQAARVLRAEPAEAALQLEGEADGHHFQVEVALADGARDLRYRVRDTLARGGLVRGLQSRYAFAEPTVDFCFTPHIRPREDQVIGQYNFKSPAVILQRGALLAAIVPDLDLIRRDAPLLVCLEADVSPHSGAPPMLGFGFKDHEPDGLVYFRHRPEMVRVLPPGPLDYGYTLYTSATAEPGWGYREITRLLWARHGQAHARSVTPQTVPFDRYADEALGYALPNLWRELPMDGEECGALVMGIKFPNDVWFHFFFNHLHTAYLLHRLAQRRGDDALLARARKIRNLALAAPARDGFRPAIFSHEIVTGLRRDRWIPHAHWVGGAIPYQTQISHPRDLPAYNTMDGSWTAYWMLRWYTDLERAPRLLDAAQAYAEQLLRLQLPSGAVPVFVDAETLEPDDRLRESPSCAGSGLFLAQLHAVTRDPRPLRAAERLADFLAREVMPQGWADYETFYDSAGKPADLYDRHTRQRPQNTFGMYWTAELSKLLYRLTGREEYRLQALRALDYLLLFQAVWSPPYLSVNGFGSLGVGNGHTGWNDARSGIFAPGIADFGLLTGEVEYLQRGVAAMRAPLALMYLPENAAVAPTVYDQGPRGYADEAYAHRGRDARLGPSCFDFSVGYALGAFSELWPRLGSAYLDLERGVGIGVDGVTVDQLSLSGDTANLQLADHVGHGRPLTLRLAGAPPASLHLRVNDGPARSYSADEVRAGIQVQP